MVNNEHINFIELVKLICYPDDIVEIVSVKNTHNIYFYDWDKVKTETEHKKDDAEELSIILERHNIRDKELMFLSTKLWTVQRILREFYSIGVHLKDYVTCTPVACFLIGKTGRGQAITKDGKRLIMF